MSALLINEHPLMVLPGLAVKIGLNEAIVLQQIHYWTRDQRNMVDGLSWTYNSIPEWRKQFPFWSEVTIRRTLGSLEEKGLIIRRKLSENRFDATHWYALDMSKLAEMDDHIDPIKMIARCDQNERVRSDQIDHITSTETNTKTTTKTKERASRLSSEWEPSDEDVFFCRNERSDLDVRKVAAEFRDYWIAQPGAKGRKTDWPATWRNWVRRQRGAQPGFQGKQEKAKAFMDVLTGRTDNYDANDPFTIDAAATRVA